ncbi:MAG: GAF domain-containing protein [Terriglobales bacterium]
MPGSSQPEDRLPPAEPSFDDVDSSTGRSSSAEGVTAAGLGIHESRSLEVTELDSALQLLVERAQYITGATGAALALPENEEMVCRASAGSSAPEVGARLQVRSGLTAESIVRRQLLRCDNAETDPRVNLEACRALGIASIVVLPLLRSSGEVRGLFELFSDHPYAFEERDLIALERMADLTITALDLAEQRTIPATAAKTGSDAEKPAELSKEPVREASIAEGGQEVAKIAPLPGVEEQLPAPPAISASPVEAAPVAALPEAMRRVQKCASCGFPVSEGRTLCLDCEKKGTETKSEGKTPDKIEGILHEKAEEPAELTSKTADEFVPAFLANSEAAQESWLAKHAKLLAIIVVILAVLVAIVVFR